MIGFLALVEGHKKKHR